MEKAISKLKYEASELAKYGNFQNIDIRERIDSYHKAITYLRGYEETKKLTFERWLQVFYIRPTYATHFIRLDNSNKTKYTFEELLVKFKALKK